MRLVQVSVWVIVVRQACPGVNWISSSALLLVFIIAIVAFRTQITQLLVLFCCGFAFLAMQTRRLIILQTTFSGASFVQRSRLSANFPARSRENSLCRHMQSWLLISLYQQLGGHRLTILSVQSLVIFNRLMLKRPAAVRSFKIIIVIQRICICCSFCSIDWIEAVLDLGTHLVTAWLICQYVLGYF